MEETQMTLKPLFDKVVLKKVEAEETTKVGIILTGSAKEKPDMSEVVAVGPGTAEVKMVLGVGDKVIVGKYTGTEVKVDGVEYTVVSQSDILAIVE
jgi:chaperonin GroES